jgi:hypothetical protein
LQLAARGGSDGFIGPQPQLRVASLECLSALADPFVDDIGYPQSIQFEVQHALHDAVALGAL